MSFLDRSFCPRWSQCTPDRVVPEMTQALADAAHAIDALCRQDRGAMNFTSVLLGFEQAVKPLSESWRLVCHLESVANSEALRAVYNEMLPQVTEFYTHLMLNESLWDLLVTWSRTDEAQALTGVQRRFMDETLAEFRQSGADLPADKKARLAQIEAELAQATQKYSENVLDSTNAWDLIVEDPAKIVGLPVTAAEAAQADAAARGHGTAESPAWRFTLKAPSLVPALENLESDELRREIWQASTTIGRGEKHDNTALIWEILRLRQEKAQLLGYQHFADLTTSRRMAKTGLTALQFSEKLHDRIKTAFSRQVRELQEYKAESSHSDPSPLYPWEVAYYSENLRKEKYEFDDDEVRPYFPIDGVLSGLFDLCGILFGIKITERATVFVDASTSSDVRDASLIEVWHPEVKFYEMHNAAGEHIGSFYADWHPRDSKRGGAWMNYFRTGAPATATEPRRPHLGLICGNLRASTPTKPALLGHSEVETVFHEFGHLLHHLLGEVSVESLNGVNVAWDFVELPSQIMENFCWERVSLDLFARHFETGKKIPQDLFKKMVAAKNFQSALRFMRQLALGKLDLELHMRHGLGEPGDLDAVTEKILEGWQMPLKVKSPTMARRFSHLFSSPTGYAAGYYSYKWAEVLDADAFSQFKEKDVLSGEVGQAFASEILSKGNSEDPEVLFRRFMGRAPDADALLRRSGLA